MYNNLASFAELIKKATEDKLFRELAETERKEKEVAPLLSELFASVAKAKNLKHESLIAEAPLIKELQSALTDPKKFRTENQETKNKIVDLVTELENTALSIQTKVNDPGKTSKIVVTDLEKKFLKLYNRLQNDFHTLKKYVDSKPTSSYVGSSSGSGEVRILRMDDISKDVAPIDGDTLVWSTTLNKFELRAIDSPVTSPVDFVSVYYLSL